MNDSGTNADSMAILRHRVEPAGCSGACACHAAPGDITWLARSDVSNFGFAPTIHPLPQYPPAIGVCQLASVAVTLSFREKIPIPETAAKHEIVSRLWGGHLPFAMPQMAEGASGRATVYEYLILVKI
jgi:hypothetical protein